MHRKPRAESVDKSSYGQETQDDNSNRIELNDSRVGRISFGARALRGRDREISFLLPPRGRALGWPERLGTLRREMQGGVDGSVGGEGLHDGSSLW